MDEETVKVIQSAGFVQISPQWLSWEYKNYILYKVTSTSLGLNLRTKKGLSISHDLEILIRYPKNVQEIYDAIDILNKKLLQTVEYIVRSLELYKNSYTVPNE